MVLSATVITAICWVRTSSPAALELYGKSFSRLLVLLLKSGPLTNSAKRLTERGLLPPLLRHRMMEHASKSLLGDAGTGK